MKDRLSVHIENGQSGIREAVTVLRNGGQASQSGLVGITNAVYADGSDPIIPETIFNVQSTGDSNIRFSSGPSKFFRSSLELIGNGNVRSSGLHISYNPEEDDAFILDGYYGDGELCVSSGAEDRTVVDFSMIRPSGREGMEFSHISMSEIGYVGIGLSRSHTTRHFHPNAPLTIAYFCDGIPDSGTVSLHEQSSEPLATSDYGKIYVKPFTTGGRSQALFFIDDLGNETNLVLNPELDAANPSGGLIYGNNGNTYGGWHTPKVRQQDASKSFNTYYGWGAGHDLSGTGTVACNTLIGFHAGSGLGGGSIKNTVVGCHSLNGYTSATNNVIIGDENIINGGGSFGGIDDTIIIGRNLYNTSVPTDGTLALGFGDSPLLLGQLVTDRYLSVMNADFSVVELANSEFQTSFQFDGTFDRYSTILKTIDLTKVGTANGVNNLKFNFANSVGLTQTLFTLDPIGGPLTNSPNYNTPVEQRPFAELDADFKIRGAIYFQDGTVMSGLSESNLTPLVGTSGVSILSQNDKRHTVLDFSNLELVGSVSQDGVRTDNTFIATQVDGTSSTLVGKMSIAGLATYINSGTSTLTENCNVLISNPENRANVNVAAISRSVMMGCDVAYGSSGWKNSVIIGSEAGANATVSNPLLDIDTSVVFIGHRAGYDCDNVDNIIGIGTNAAKDSDSASDSIFIGSNAGLAASYSNSIGVGEHALRGTSGVEGGSGNLEIVCGIDDNNRLMYNGGSLSNRINIMNVMAGRNDIPNMSIGVPRLSPTAPLEVRRDSVAHSGNNNSHIQQWYCDNTLVAYVDCSGDFKSSYGSGGGDAFQSDHIEGLLASALTVGTMAAPSSGILDIYEDGVSTGETIYITNRDSSFKAPIGKYLIATRMKNEYRAIWVSSTYQLLS